MIEYLPYIVTVICSLTTGSISYFCACKKARSEMEQLEKKHCLDIENEREKHKLELERIEIEHKHRLELKQKDFEESFGSEVLKNMMELPEIKRQLSQGIRNGNRKKS